MIGTHQGPQPLTAEEAAQQMRDAWTRDNQNKVAAWNIQLEQDRAEATEQERLAHEEEEARHAQQQKEAEEQRRESEKKKPRLNPFDPNRRIGSWIEPRPAPYALDKINLLEYVELDYFTTKGCQEAALDANKSINLDTMGFAQFEGALALRPLAAQRSSKTIRNDEDLAWEEMLEAKNTMLHFMAQSRVWPTAHAESTAAFFVALELHPRRLQANGKKALLLYQSRVRQEWFSALKRDEGFNIEIIGEDFLRSCAEIVNDQIREKELQQVCVIAPHPTPPPLISRSLLLPSPQCMCYP
jgi:hypothetical protein